VPYMGLLFLICRYEYTIFYMISQIRPTHVNRGG